MRPLHSKEDFRRLMFGLLEPLKPLYSAGGARLTLEGAGATYPKQVMELESFSRVLWALAPFWAGGGHDGAFEALYTRGLANGTNPQSDEYWGGFFDYDQRFVEMAALACGLLFAPDKLWNPLTDIEKSRLAEWLSGINQYVIPLCNWQFFRVLVNLALKKCGMPYSEEKLAVSLAEIESYYIGGGWYKDGASSQKDYYISFAMHYYGLIYAKLMERDDPERSQQYKERAIEFAKDFIYWFAEDGSALPFGRSLAYRFAQASFWSACLFADIEPFHLGVMKGLLTRHFDYWLAQDIVDRDGILTVGYAYPNLIMAERYNAPGSPYWSMKSFLLLALPDSHSFWSVPSEPLPELTPTRPLPYADMLIHRRENDVVAYAAGVCELYGHGHLVEKYSKFAYSTAFGFSVMRSAFTLSEACPDSMLAFVINDTVYVRKKSSCWHVNGDSVISQWSPFPGVRVKTTITPTPDGHTRHHEVESDIDCAAIDYGFAVPKFTEPEYEEILTDRTAAVRTKYHFCETESADPGAKPEILNADPNSNILYPNTAIPGIRYVIEKGVTLLETAIRSGTASAGLGQSHN